MSNHLQVIVSDPSFRHMVEIANRLTGVWAASPGIDLTKMKRGGPYMAHLLWDEHNRARAEQGLKPLTREELAESAEQHFLKNKVAVAIDITDGEVIYAYNHDGTAYLCCGLKD